MTHRKITHEEKVPLCANFSEAKCGFQDSCWFSHDASKCKDAPKFECNLCDKSFTIKTIFMSHRKQEHGKFVEMCRDEMIGSCRYGSKKCWFTHQNKNLNINENMTKNMKNLEYDNHNDIMQKLIDLVEKHTEKIVFLENQLKDGANTK